MERSAYTIIIVNSAILQSLLVNPSNELNGHKGYFNRKQRYTCEMEFAIKSVRSLMPDLHPVYILY